MQVRESELLVGRQCTRPNEVEDAMIARLDGKQPDMKFVVDALSIFMDTATDNEVKVLLRWIHGVDGSISGHCMSRADA